MLKTCIAIGLLLLLGLGSYIYRGHQSLANLRAHLIAKGEILDWRQLGTNAAPHQINGMPDLVAAANDLPELPPGLPTRFSPRPGFVVDITRIKDLPAELFVIRGGKRDLAWVSNVWSEIGPPIDASRSVWQRAVDATTNEVMLHQIDWRTTWSSTVIPERDLRNLWRWSKQAAALYLQRDQVEQAMDVTTTALRIQHLSHAVPSVLGELARSPVHSYSGAVVWWMLQRDLSDAQLVSLRDALSPLAITDAAQRALELERATIIQLWETLLTDSAKARSMLETDNPVVLYLWQLAPSHHDLGWYLHTSQKEIAALREAIERRSFQHLSDTLRPQVNPPRIYLFSQCVGWPQLDFLLLVFKAEVRREFLLTGIALERFHLQHSRYPKTLDKLVPEFRDRLPADWMNGQALRYESMTNSFRLWSVGGDFVDQGGDPLHPKKSNGWLNGRDYVWPTAATPEETRKYAEDCVANWKAASSKP